MCQWSRQTSTCTTGNWKVWDLWCFKNIYSCWPIIWQREGCGLYKLLFVDHTVPHCQDTHYIKFWKLCPCTSPTKPLKGGTIWSAKHHYRKQMITKDVTFRILYTAYECKCAGYTSYHSRTFVLPAITKCYKNINLLLRNMFHGVSFVLPLKKDASFT
jgi:hypothetical protein